MRQSAAAQIASQQMQINFRLCSFAAQRFATAPLCDFVAAPVSKITNGQHASGKASKLFEPSVANPLEQNYTLLAALILGNAGKGQPWTR